MSAGASAITIFHPPSNPERFSRWVAAYQACARHSLGHVGTRESVHEVGLDWAVEVVFDSADRLDAWLDGAERAAVLGDGEAQGFWRCASDLILVEGEPPPGNVGIFLHSVAAGSESEFAAAQGDLTCSSSTFPGYQGTAVFPADSAGQWMSVLRFRTPQQLAGWIGSRERHEALPRLRTKLTRDFAELPHNAPFGSTIRIDQGHTRITPGWKTAMLVLLCLYPTVMALSAWLSPVLSRLGIGPSLSVFVGNAISIALLQWVLVPAVSRPFRRWLDPIDGASGRISLAGAAVIAIAYGALLVIFPLIA